MARVSEALAVVEDPATAVVVAVEVVAAAEAEATVMAVEEAAEVTLVRAAEALAVARAAAKSQLLWCGQGPTDRGCRRQPVAAAAARPRACNTYRSLFGCKRSVVARRPRRPRRSDRAATGQSDARDVAFVSTACRLWRRERVARNDGRRAHF